MLHVCVHTWMYSTLVRVTWCVQCVPQVPGIYYTLCIPNFLAVPLLDLVPPLLSVLRFTLSYSTTLSSGQIFTHPHTTATKQHAEQHHQNPILANQKFQFRNVKEMKLYHDWCWWFVCSWVPLAGLYNHKYASQLHADMASMMDQSPLVNGSTRTPYNFFFMPVGLSKIDLPVDFWKCR